MITPFEEGEVCSGEVGEVDGAFDCGCHDAYDAAEGRGVIEEGEEVLNEPDSGVGR